MCITEYDEARTMELFKEEGRIEGRTEDRTEGREEEKISNPDADAAAEDER